MDSDDSGKPKKQNPYENRPYDVGKGKPPQHTRFKPGQLPSKRSGRPKGSKNRTSIDRLLDKKVVVRRNTGSTRMPMSDVITQRLLKDAAEGDLKSIKIVMPFIRDAGLRKLDTENGEMSADEKKQRAELASELIKLLEFAAEANKYGIIKSDGSTRLKLASWVVEAARRRLTTGCEDIDDEG